MKFEINNTKWTIDNVDEGQMQLESESKFNLGVTIYKSQRILLDKDQANITKTLKHELMHVWLYEYGHSQNDNKFTYEDVCEIAASSNDFINEVVNRYLGIEPLYLCDKEKNTECKKNNCDICMYTNNKEFAKSLKN